MPTRLVDDGNYVAGMVREKPSWQLPPGAVADCSNIIFDIQGLARQRGGTTALVSGAQTAFATSIGIAHSADATPIEELYGVAGKTGHLHLINKASGAATDLGLIAAGATDTIFGRPANHFGFLAFPGRGTPSSTTFRSVMAAGQTSTTAFTSTVAASVAASDSIITLTGADVTTNVKVGSIVSMTDGTNAYYGRVVEILTAKTFSVWPPSSYAITAAGAQLSTLPFALQLYAACVTSFQGRLIWGGPINYTGTAQVIQDRRFAYSTLLPESYLEPSSGINQSGASFTQYGILGYPEKNFIEIPWADSIVAMEPVSDGELLILTASGVVIFTGTLATQTTTFAPGVTFDVYGLPTPAGCLSDLSVQKTPIGVMWASTEGIFAYWPPLRKSPAHTGLRNVTEGSILTYWRDLTRGANFAIHGSAYVRNHYIVTGTSGGATFALSYNVTTGAWGPLSAIDWFLGVRRPTDPSQVFVSRWWDQTGSAPSMTNGQTLRADSIFAPDVAGQTKTDADGGVVAFTLKTRSLTDDLNSERILRRVSARYQLEATGANVAVSAGARLDTQDTAGVPTTALGNLSNTSVLTITGQSNATPIVITTSANHGLQSEDQVDIHGVTTNSNANGRWRIIVLSPTTFSLNQSIGNGASTSTGTCKKITEQEFVGTGVDIGQANYLSLASVGAVNKFQFFGWRASVMEMARGLGR